MDSSHVWRRTRDSGAVLSPPFSKPPGCRQVGAWKQSHNMLFLTLQPEPLGSGRAPGSVVFFVCFVLFFDTWDRTRVLVARQAVF